MCFCLVRSRSVLRPPKFEQNGPSNIKEYDEQHFSKRWNLAFPRQPTQLYLKLSFCFISIRKQKTVWLSTCTDCLFLWRGFLLLLKMGFGVSFLWINVPWFKLLVRSLASCRTRHGGGEISWIEKASKRQLQPDLRDIRHSNVTSISWRDKKVRTLEAKRPFVTMYLCSCDWFFPFHTTHWIMSWFRVLYFYSFFSLPLSLPTDFFIMHS